jgi:methionyl-tRNA synthetase
MIFNQKNNNELLANLGNLINRVLVFTYKNFNGKIPKFNEEKFKKEEDIKFSKDLLNLFNQYILQQSKTYIKEALKTAMEISSLGNGHLQLTTPWNLLKEGKETYDLARAESLFFVFCCLIRLIGVIMEPFMPSFSAKLYELMNVKYEGKELYLLKTLNDYINNTKDQPELFIVKCGLVSEGQPLNAPHPLFKKITDDEIKGFKQTFGTGK